MSSNILLALLNKKELIFFYYTDNVKRYLPYHCCTKKPIYFNSDVVKYVEKPVAVFNH